MVSRGSIAPTEGPTDRRAVDWGGGPGPVVRVLVEPHTVAATRAVLAVLAEHPAPLAVVGWADLSSPNLVDLLDELVDGPGGSHLAAIAQAAPSEGAEWVDDVAIRRGLACLQRFGLSLRLIGPVPPRLLARLAAEEPALAVLVDDAAPASEGSGRA